MSQDTGSVPKKSAQFLLYVLKNAENNSELKGLDLDSLVTELTQVNKLPSRSTELTQLMGGLACTRALPATLRCV